MADDRRRAAGPHRVLARALAQRVRRVEAAFRRRAPGLHQVRDRAQRNRGVAGDAQQRLGVAHQRLPAARQPGHPVGRRRVVPEVDPVDPFEQVDLLVHRCRHRAQAAEVDVEPGARVQHRDARLVGQPLLLERVQRDRGLVEAARRRSARARAPRARAAPARGRPPGRSPAPRGRAPRASPGSPSGSTRPAPRTYASSGERSRNAAGKRSRMRSASPCRSSRRAAAGGRSASAAAA